MFLSFNIFLTNWKMKPCFSNLCLKSLLKNSNLKPKKSHVKKFFSLELLLSSKQLSLSSLYSKSFIYVTKKFKSKLFFLKYQKERIFDILVHSFISVYDVLCCPYNKFVSCLTCKSCHKTNCSPSSSRSLTLSALLLIMCH